MRRRDFITLLAGAAVAWPLAARAQQAAKLPTIGFLVAGTPSSHGHWVAAFVQRLRELGWIEARSIAIEYRWAEGRTDRAAEIASCTPGAAMARAKPGQTGLFFPRCQIAQFDCSVCTSEEADEAGT